MFVIVCCYVNYLQIHILKLFYTLAKKSQYREAWSFITDLYQKRVLNEIDVEFHYDDDVDQTVIKSGNPCHWRDENIRVFFTGIDIFSKYCM